MSKLDLKGFFVLQNGSFNAI